MTVGGAASADREDPATVHIGRANGLLPCAPARGARLYRMRAVLLSLLLLPFTARATDPAALLDLAATHYAERGRATALADFSRDPRFQEGALYVFCVDRDGKLSANGGFPGLVGMRVDRFEVGGERDLATRMRAQVEREGSGSIDYVWLNPATGVAERKHSQLRRMGEDVCGVGTYTPLPTPGPPRRR